MKNIIEGIQYQFEMFTRLIREQKLFLFSSSKSFYCQSEIEMDGKCDEQYQHCKDYYKHLDQ